MRFSRVCIKHLLCTQLSLCIRVIKSDKRFKDGWSHYQSRGFHPQCSVTKCRCSGSDRLSWCIRKKHLAKWPNTPFMLQTFFFSFHNVWSIFSHSLPVDDAGNIEVEINYTNPAPNRKLVRGCLRLLCASHSDMGLQPSYDWLKDTFKNLTTVFVFIFKTACHMPQIRERFVQNIRANVKRNTISDMVTKARKQCVLKALPLFLRARLVFSSWRGTAGRPGVCQRLSQPWSLNTGLFVLTFFHAKSLLEICQIDIYSN